ncbi:Thymidylate kinase [Austwickia sp. TVS 96-490-7B]|uniref:dTMP kinase n=1 Tax=Austwickia sp. TVS 96-490-7B TaxID=2830843 RepID=UPI001C59DE37|nr:dTMP kinase [Austwickia sp. TVS 96-490-7B]MBW3084886.1 Thymidylate kinase [Austwickia sp. TVS 96-490-7B]
MTAQDRSATSSSQPRRGVLIAFEGGDGAGKSTQIARLTRWLAAHGREFVVTREPGGTELGERVREVLLHGGAVSARAEALLFAADRAHHVDTVIRPALEAGQDVITDRFMDSSIAYQGAGRALGADEVKDLSLWATGGLLPDLTVLLDVAVDVGAARRTGHPDRLEAEVGGFHERVRAHFLALAQAEPARYLVVDASLPSAQIGQVIADRLVATGWFGSGT